MVKRSEENPSDLSARTVRRTGRGAAVRLLNGEQRAISLLLSPRGGNSGKCECAPDTYPDALGRGKRGTPKNHDG